MRRWSTYQNRNHNSTVVNNFSSNEESSASVSPEVVMGQMWLQDDTTQIEIIELDSDGAEITTTERQDHNFGQYWHYVDKDRFSMPEPEMYKTNRKAREKRRLAQNSQYAYNANSPENLENEFAEVVNDIVYSSFYGSMNDISDSKTTHKTNCFTIINKTLNSDSSSDEIEFNDRMSTSDQLNGDTPYDGEILTFDQDVDASKRTVWIYSFRNKRMLSDNDFELVNIPSQDSTSSTSCSLDNFCDEPNVRKNASRVSSPIPATYVPRLNLSMASTLPTVTEISEPTRNVPAEISKSVNSPVNRHKSNNWLDERIIINGYINHSDKEDKSSNTNVINWMSLSPRERRRRSRHTKFSPTYQSKLPPLVEVPSNEPKSNDSLNGNAHKIETTAEINIVDETPKKVETVSSTNNSPTRSGKGDRPDGDLADLNNLDADGGDFNKQLQKPQITIRSGRPKCATITDPIEKLDSNNWIHEDKKQGRNTTVSEIQEFKICSGDASNVCAGNRLWARNLSLLKPVAWCEFLPITESVPSLHLSIESETNKKTWYTCLAKCFRCFR